MASDIATCCGVRGLGARVYWNDYSVFVDSSGADRARLGTHFERNVIAL